MKLTTTRDVAITVACVVFVLMVAFVAWQYVEFVQAVREATTPAPTERVWECEIPRVDGTCAQWKDPN